MEAGTAEVLEGSSVVFMTGRIDLWLFSTDRPKVKAIGVVYRFEAQEQ
jgi:hypothetical protein